LLKRYLADFGLTDTNYSSRASGGDET